MSFDPELFCVGPTASIREAMERIDRNQGGIVLVTDLDGRLMGTVVDGDVRRAMLANLDLGHPVADLLAIKARTAYAQPVVARRGTDPDTILRRMREASVRQMPIVDEDRRVVDLLTIEDLMPDHRLAVEAVIMAGGQGTRLRPLTRTVPKPMLPVGDKPILERIVQQLKASGVKRVNVATNYLGDQIKDHFQDGRAFGIELHYVSEDQPLGTAGALSLFAPSADPILVINGDIVTEVDFRAMLDYHRDHQAELTVALRKYEFVVPYGVVTLEGALVEQIQEKPVQSFFVNAGIYLLEPSAHQLIPKGIPCDMTDLIQRLLDEGRPVAGFPIWEYWIDVGQHADYERAQRDIAGTVSD